MRCRTSRSTVILPLCTFLLLIAPLARAQTEERSPRQILTDAINRWVNLAEPSDDAKPRTLTATVKLVQSKGMPRELTGLEGQFAYQAPDRLLLSGTVNGETYAAARDRQQLWVHEPGKKFAVLGKAGVAPFKAEPDNLDHTVLPPFHLPISRLKLSMLTLMLDVQADADEKINDQTCHVLRVTLQPKAADLLGINVGEAKLWLRDSDSLPLRVTYADEHGTDLRADIEPKLVKPWTAEQWKLKPAADDHVETVALSHLVRFLEVAPRVLQERIPELGPATGEHDLVATSGKGRLESIANTRVLFLKGSPEEMGRQQGRLLNAEIHRICDHILYGVGVGSSFAKGKWFISEIEGAEARLEPFMDKRYLAEMDAMAKACGMDPQEARLSNFFPELFHCSGFSLFGKAVADGHMYHGRVLDYLRGVGLENNAVVMVYQPDYGNAWVNVGYAGFIGSVTAMNEKGISIGEMGGNGYGDWDGKPMAHLVREVMEKASTLDEAVRIMRESPRTCQYYYVISDGNTKQAVGIAATPNQFLVIHPGEAVPQLPHAFDDAVLMSAGDRYETLSQRVKLGYGKFDADSARDLMTRPVCMTSNIHSVLFEPDTLDFWVANADSKHVASAARYTHYNLKDLLKEAAPPADVSSDARE